MSATISDVARLAGVGRGTVSRVLNERANVDAATRGRVLAAIRELDFVPSPTARRLSLRRTQTVAVILPFLTRPSAVERLRGIEFAIVSAGYDMIVFNVETAERRDAVFRELPRPERVDGLIIVSLSPARERARAHSAFGAAHCAGRRPSSRAATRGRRRRPGRPARDGAPHRPRAPTDRVHRRLAPGALGLHLESPAPQRLPSRDGSGRPCDAGWTHRPGRSLAPSGVRSWPIAC